MKIKRPGPHSPRAVILKALAVAEAERDEAIEAAGIHMTNSLEWMRQRDEARAKLAALVKAYEAMQSEGMIQRVRTDEELAALVGMTEAVDAAKAAGDKA